MSTVRTERGGVGGTRALLMLVIGMGVLIAAGTVVVVATLVHRTFATAAARVPAAAGTAAALPGIVALDQPPGSRIASMLASDGRLALLVSGGGEPDRVVLLDARDGSTVALVRLDRAPTLPP